MHPEDLNEQQLIRRDKANQLKDMGVDPFGSAYQRTHTTKEIRDTYGPDDHDTLEEKAIEVIVAGRIMLKRRQGRAGFINLQDRDGQLQIYVRKDEIGDDAFEVFKAADLGDIIGIEGYLFRTKTDELTIKATVFTHLTKALRPLPDKFHGLQDKEEARRRRYVDLIVNDDARRVAMTRPKIIRAFQHFFDSRGFIELRHLCCTAS